MKIAIVGPSPVPFTVGGAEKLFAGLYNTLTQHTMHQVELIKLPSREHSFWDIIDNYYQFYRLDLSQFDTVIVTKYPSWMVRHKHKICYMLHTLRGLYDTYFLPEDIETDHPAVQEVLCYMQDNPRPMNLDDFFELLFELKEKRQEISSELFAFPGPLIRKIVHYLDLVGMSYGVDRYTAISNTVKNRKDYFPEGVDVQAIYPPSVLKDYTAGEYKHIFMASRLDTPKRIDMLIRAMKHVVGDTRLYIAGTGPDEERLRGIAKADERIEFLGFVSDELIEKYYANSLVIPYFPYDEDYGYITLEAMMHKKPVITTVDAGGPNEFVENGETGFVTEFDEKKIADKINYFVSRPDEAKRMGCNAFEKVKNITWENVIDELLAWDQVREPPKKLVVTSTFPIYPPRGGGQARTFHLYKNIAKTIETEIVSFGLPEDSPVSNLISPRLTECRVPKSQRHQEMECNMQESAGTPITDIGMIYYSKDTPDYGSALKEAIDQSDCVVLSHPYLFYEVQKYIGDKPFIYEAQDVEYIIKKEILANSKKKKEYLESVFEIEAECCRKSAFIATCSQEDSDTLAKLYHISADKFLVVPNGVDVSQTIFTPVDQRRQKQESAGLGNEKIGIFMGSWHGPNLEACEKIFELALLCPSVKFILMGSQCDFFDRRSVPSNIGMLGIVEEHIKNRVFSLADFALNPMTSGSGTNLKMFDYMAAGLPIITTEFGTRGIDNKDIFLIAESVHEMAERINCFCLQEEQERVKQARIFAEKNFDWNVIADTFIKKLEELGL